MGEEIPGEALNLRGRAPEKQASLMETSQWERTPPHPNPDRGFHGDRTEVELWHGCCNRCDLHRTGGGRCLVGGGPETWQALVWMPEPCSHSPGGQLWEGLRVMGPLPSEGLLDSSEPHPSRPGQLLISPPCQPGPPEGPTFADDTKPASLKVLRASGV
jgi:hypothetical protein